MERATRIAALVAVIAAVSSSAAAGARPEGGESNGPIVVSDVNELQDVLVPANAGRRIVVRRGTYLVSSPLVVPDGASLVGEGVMLGDSLPTGFAPGTETTIQAVPAFSGDILALGNDSSLKNLVVADSAGRSGNVIGARSRGPDDTISASIKDCEIVTPNPAGIAPDGPTGRAVAVVTQNPNLAAAPPPHDGAHLALTITHSLVRATAGAANALFAINFASHTQIVLELRESVFVGGVDASGGVPRPDAVSFSSITIDSRHNRYVASGFAPWRLIGGTSPPAAFPTGAATWNKLSMESMGDRLESPSLGIFAVGGRRVASLHEPVSNNTNSLRIRDLTLLTSGVGSSDLTVAGALSLGEFSPGDHNTLTLDMRGSTGSGERLNVYANTLGPLLPQNLGQGNALRIAGTPEAFSERNPGILPAPPAEFFVG